MGLSLLALLAVIGMAVLMAAAWLLQQRLGSSRWVDVCWTFSTGLMGALLALLPWDGNPLRQISVALFALFWSLRLGGHLAKRNAKLEDDPRYRHLTEQWGATAPRRMFFFLQSQAIVGALLAFCIALAAHHPNPYWRWQDGAGIALLAIALAGEALADRQLRAFRRAAKGQICDSGLWAWSRHPNYFFEWLVWLGVAVLALDFAHLGWLALAAPAVMYWTLVYVSGIPPLELHMQNTRPEAFRRYQARVSRFFPWPPKT